MRREQWAAVAMVAAGVGTIIWAVFQFDRMLGAEARLKSALREADQWRRQISLVEERYRGIDRDRASLQAAVRHALDLRNAQNAASPVRPHGTWLEQWSLTANDPVLRALYLKSVRAGLDARYGRLFRMLHLSPEQIEKFKDVEVASQELFLDTMASEEKLGIEPGDPIVGRLGDHNWNQLKHQMTAALGSADGTVFQQYVKTEGLQPVVTSLATHVYDTDTPLTAEQAAAIQQILVDNSRKQKYGFVIGGTTDWDAAYAQAQAVLSPEQLAAFRSIKDETTAERQMIELSGSLSSIASP